MPHNSKEAEIIYSAENYIKTAQEVTEGEFFAVMCSFGVPYKCTYHLEYAFFAELSNNLILGLIDCVSEKYYVSKALRKEDVLAARDDPFINFKLDYDSL